MPTAEICSVTALIGCLAAALARPRGLPEAVFGLPIAAALVLAAPVTAVLTLDAKVVLLTPVVLRGARPLGLPARPHAFACVELANAGSLLLPISNLTNLLAFSAAGLSFGRFAGLMALPWVIAIAIEWAGPRLFFRADLRAAPAPAPPRPTAPRYALGVVAMTVASFVGFVFALGVIVDAVDRHGAAKALDRVLPHGGSLATLLAVAFIAALAANVVNNLPATLALEFHRYGLLSVPIILASATVALWVVS